MLYHLLFELKEYVSVFNVVRYITFRTAMATLSALLIVLLFGPWMIERLRRLKFGQQIRSDGPETHKAKAGTPTMGGILIVVGTLVPTFLWGDLTNRNIWILIFATLAFGGIGFADDYIKIVKKRSLGLTARQVRHPGGDDLETGAFEAGVDLTDHVLGNRVRLDDRQRAFNGHKVLLNQ